MHAEAGERRHAEAKASVALVAEALDETNEEILHRVARCRARLIRIKPTVTSSLSSVVITVANATASPFCRTNATGCESTKSRWKAATEKRFSHLRHACLAKHSRCARSRP